MSELQGDVVGALTVCSGNQCRYKLKFIPVGPELRIGGDCKWLNPPSVSDTKEANIIIQAKIEEIISLIGAPVPVCQARSITVSGSKESAELVNEYLETGVCPEGSKPIDRRGPQ